LKKTGKSQGGTSRKSRDFFQANVRRSKRTNVETSTSKLIPFYPIFLNTKNKLQG
jgi:hypothetical protein